MLRNINDETHDKQSCLGLKIAQLNLDRELAAILAPSIQFQSAAHRTHSWCSKISRTISDVTIPNRFWYEHFYRLSYKFIVSIAKQGFGLIIDYHSAPCL